MKLAMTKVVAAGICVMCLGVANAQDLDRSGSRNYEITITNITKGQVFSPPVLVTHKRSVELFELGAPASAELAMVAEDGNGGPLADLLNSISGVGVAQATMMPIAPGGSATYHISSGRSFNELSIAGMLVNTNDAFFAIDAKRLPVFRNRSHSFIALAYDAGSENNNEDCAFIPGPACSADSGNARDIDGAESFVYVHNGVHGMADLDPSAHDWRNPVARITVKRTR